MLKIVLIIFWVCNLQAQNIYKSSNAYYSNAKLINNSFYFTGLTTNENPLKENFYILEKYNLNYKSTFKDSIYIETKNKYYDKQKFYNIKDTTYIISYYWNLFSSGFSENPRLILIKEFNDKIEKIIDSTNLNVGINKYIPVCNMFGNNIYSLAYNNNNELAICVYNLDGKLEQIEIINKFDKNINIIPLNIFKIEEKYIILYQEIENNRYKTIIDVLNFDYQFLNTKEINDSKVAYEISELNNNKIYITYKYNINQFLEMENHELVEYDLEMNNFRKIKFGLTTFDKYNDIDIIDNRIVLSGYKNQNSNNYNFPEYPLVTNIYNMDKVYYNLITENELYFNYIMSYNVVDNDKAVIIGHSRINNNEYFFKELSQYATVLNKNSDFKYNIYLETNILEIMFNDSEYKLYDINGSELKIYNYVDNNTNFFDFTKIIRGVYILKNSNHSYLIYYNPK